ncbi:hypothetical protein BG004_001745 [Podila humilis]|nr:hypothetical protein BG004_001745 [Podila humilis]
MGVRGLSKVIKASGGFHGQQFGNSSKVHADLPSLVFRLSQTKGFEMLQSNAKKETTQRTSAGSELSTARKQGTLKRSIVDEHVALPFLREPIPSPEDKPFGSTKVLTELLAETGNIDGFDHVFITENGLSPTEPREQQAPYACGRSRELVAYDKEQVRAQLDLPSDLHLLLMCVVTTNDYIRGVPYYGLQKNSEIIRDLALDGEQ